MMELPTWNYLTNDGITLQTMIPLLRKSLQDMAIYSQSSNNIDENAK